MDKYYVFVEGEKAPKVVHDSIAVARTEARRLASKEVNKSVSICRIEEQYIGEVVVNIKYDRGLIEQPKIFGKPNF